MAGMVAAAMVLLAQAPGRAEPPGAGENADPGTCSEAAGQAERAWNLPDGLLAAIGRIESGRPDPGTGRLEPSRWAINVAGEGRFFDTADAAIAYVQALQARGIRSIDVGCFQVNLMYHPAAFASIGEAFDTRANAGAAARFLSELYQRSGDWEAAVARYHSALPERGEPYRIRVLQQWHGGGAVSGALRANPAETPDNRDRVVMLLAPAAAAIPVFTPANIAIPADLGPGQPGSLPRVFRPTTR